MELAAPVGWQKVPVAGAGGGPDGNTLVSYVFQMQILENHQNGKDTHLRSIKIFASDTDGASVDRDANRIPRTMVSVSWTGLALIAGLTCSVANCKHCSRGRRRGR